MDAPVGTWGLKSRMCPPYPHACRKRRLKMGRRYKAQVADTALSSNLTNNMDHMRISGAEPSSVILSQTK